MHLILFLIICLSPILLCAKDDFRTWHQTAEAAMQKKDYPTAKEAYRAILDKITFTQPLDWPAYVDLVLRYVEANRFLGTYEEAEEALARLLLIHPPENLFPQILFAKARLFSEQKKPKEALQILEELAKRLPTSNWKGEELSFYRALSFLLNAHYDSQLRKAEGFFRSSLFQEAIALYEEVLVGIKMSDYPKAKDDFIEKKIRSRLAEAYFRIAQYDKTLLLLDRSKHLQEAFDPQMLYLSALAYREKKEYEKAIDSFQTYLESKESDGAAYENALLEMGLSYWKLGNVNKAKRYFSLLFQEGRDKRASHFAALSLAKIYLSEKKPKQADELLATLKPILPTKEIDFLRGEAAFQAEEYAIASEFFEKALTFAPLVSKAKLNLGLCYLKMGEDPIKSKRVRLEFFEKAEKYLLTSFEEEALLAVGKLYVLMEKEKGDGSAYEEFQTRILAKFDAAPLEVKAKILLMHAELVKEDEARASIYEKVTAPDFQTTSVFADGWYYRGLNAFSQGLKGKREAFDEAVFALEKAFQLVDASKALAILKKQAEADYYKNAKESSLLLLEKLTHHLQEFPEEEKEEILYLRELVAAQMAREQEKESYISIAEESMNQLLALYPEGVYADRALFIMASLHYRRENYKQSKALFLRLAEKYPHSSQVNEGWYWAAEAAEKCGEPEEMIQKFRRVLFEKYPLLTYADEACFRYYSFQTYLEGKPDALDHLNRFIELYPGSPFIVIAHYLRGMNEKRENHFQEACCAFDRAIASSAAEFIEFHIRSLLESAKYHLIYADEAAPAERPRLLEIGETFLKQMLAQEKLSAALYEEAALALGQIYAKENKDAAAQKVFSELIAHFKARNIAEGEMVALAWGELAKLSLKHGEYQTGLTCLEVAGECGERTLPAEKKLEFLLWKSDCHVGLNQLSNAMRTLSAVINEDVASPLRLKAMFQRAEIYELQGREELAVRQLEAICKKGGEWGPKAQKKLEERYGIN